MKTMILDTSSQKLIISFLEDDRVLYNHISDGKNNHSDNLIKNIEAGLDSLKLEVSSFDRIIVGIGPGAYTGLRIALCVAKVFAWTKNIPLYTVSSLDLLASGKLCEEGILSIKLHAKKGYVYHKIIKTGTRLKVLENDSFLSIEEAIKLDSKYDVTCFIDNDNISFNALNISDNLLTRVSDVTFLEPNYLREGM